MLTWDRFDALNALVTAARNAAQRKASDEIGPCPNCGAVAEVEMIDVTDYDGVKFLPGLARCSARCYEREPEKYLAALQARK